MESLGDDPFDLIILSHVLEHFPDPLGVVERVLERLNPGGVLYIEVPNIRAFCLGALQGAHLYYFSDRTLHHYMGQLGLHPISLRYHGVGDVHLSTLLGKREVTSPPDLSNEYARTVKAIRKSETRERLKDILKSLHLFEHAKKIYWKIR